MSHEPETRICPICNSLLWEDDLLAPEDLELWEEGLRRADLDHHRRRRGRRLGDRGGNGLGGDLDAEILELAERFLELFLTLDGQD